MVGLLAVASLITLLCLQASGKQNYMCRKTLEATFISIHVTEYDKQAESYYNRKLIKWEKENVNDTLAGAAVIGYAAVFQHELKTTLTFHPISDTISLRTLNNFGGGAFALSWHF